MTLTKIHCSRDFQRDSITSITLLVNSVEKIKKVCPGVIVEGLPKKEWRGNYLWVKNTETIEYISANIHDGHAEYLEIVGKLYEDKMAIYNEEIGKWLDSRE